jgi:hypothetical protein
MPPLPAQDLRSNVASWAVPTALLPAVAYCLPHLGATEAFDPTFRGQGLKTTYFDTPQLALRKARRQGAYYLTLRLRCYEGGDNYPEVYALSAKTETQKWRLEVAPDLAHAVGQRPELLASQLPADLQARYLELVGDAPLAIVVCVSCRRYAVENAQDRFTLDVDVSTDTGKRLPFGVLEYKTTDPDATPPGSLQALPIRPLKLSKFLWATGV